MGTQERKIRMVSLSLTSMVDMFAILVIFLLTNSSTVSQWIDVGHDIQLPKATGQDQPVKAATIQINSETVFADRKPLTSVRQVLAGGPTSEAVRGWLAKQKKEGYVNIVADSRVPFGVVRRVIATCQASGFANVNLAVEPSS
jgi:biopolymer transport protein ExbD